MGLLAGIVGIFDAIRRAGGYPTLGQSIATGKWGRPTAAQGAPAGFAPPQPPPGFYGGRPVMPFGMPTPYGGQMRMPPRQAPMGGYPAYGGFPMSAPMQYGGPGSLYNLFRQPSYPFASASFSQQSPFLSPSQAYGLAPSAYGAPSPSAGQLPGSLAAPMYGTAPAIGPTGGSGWGIYGQQPPSYLR